MTEYNFPPLHSFLPSNAYDTTYTASPSPLLNDHCSLPLVPDPNNFHRDSHSNWSQGVLLSKVCVYDGNSAQLTWNMTHICSKCKPYRKLLYRFVQRMQSYWPLEIHTSEFGYYHRELLKYIQFSEMHMPNSQPHFSWFKSELHQSLAPLPSILSCCSLWH